MEKRVLLATILSIFFLYFWQYYIFRDQKHLAYKNVNGNNKILEEKNRNNNLFDPYIVETKSLKVVFNKYGASIREVYIKENFNSDEFSLFFKDEKDFLSLNPAIVYEVKEVDENNKKFLVFTSKNVKKTFVFNNYKNYNLDNYKVSLSIELLNPEKLNILFDKYIHSDNFSNEQNFFHMGYSLENVENKNISKKTIVVNKFDRLNIIDKKNISWVSLSSKYFMLVIFLDKNFSYSIEVDKFDKITKRLKLVTSQESKNFNIDFMFLPKKISFLKNLNYKLENTIEWGTFAFLSKLFYNILLFFYNIFNNYGIAIIWLTIVLQIFTFPLTYNSIKAAAKMRNIQPQIQFLQKVYKDDPKRLNLEIMNLYKEKKVNPFSGCLPLFLQIPIFWALFSMLRNTYDLRKANFILWIKDLSQPDRLNIPALNFSIPILVILMGFTMFLQQFISGSFNDPQQRSLSIMMPIIFTIMFSNFPSGLVLYWLINNIFSIIIQLIVNKVLKNK